ncbi:P-loop containing nucleoside triphosphate hydrolase protein, partial [Entophlyctis helioformis]
NKASFDRLGIRPSHGVLLHGPPGTGKTLIARAVAHASGADFLLLSLPSLVQGHVGESEKALANAFQDARRRAPCIIFMDEIDALFQNRDDGGDLSAKARHASPLFAQIVVEMDALAWESAAVVFLAATNYPDQLDNALMRPGRFDRLIYIGPPSESERADILRLLVRDLPVERHEDGSESVSVATIARQTAGLTGADLKELVRRSW